jgi:hypothetical protein
MKNTKNLGILVAVLGLLLTCAVCPLALNNVLVIATSGGRPQDILSLYGLVFPPQARLGNILISTLVITGQEACATVLALAALVIGVMLFSQAPQPADKSK